MNIPISLHKAMQEHMYLFQIWAVEPSAAMAGGIQYLVNSFLKSYTFMHSQLSYLASLNMQGCVGCLASLSLAISC